MTADVVGHYATIIVGVSGGPNGLSAMRIQLSDGDQYELSASEVERLDNSGIFRLVHRFEPTLTPQPQRATVVATEGSSRDKAAFVEFETQAEFKLGFSPLRVTALDDCDLVGKGDFELRWKIDARTSRTRFDLGKGETYVEEDFRRGVNGVRYNDDYGYWLSIVERDSAVAEAGQFVTIPPWEHEFFGGSGKSSVDIIQIGPRRVPVSFVYRANKFGNCHVRFDYRYTVALADNPPSA